MNASFLLVLILVSATNRIDDAGVEDKTVLQQKVEKASPSPLEVALAGGAGLVMGVLSLGVANAVTIIPVISLSNGIGPFALVPMLGVVVAAGVLATFLTEELLGEPKALMRDLGITAGTTLVGSLVGGVVGLAVFYPNYEPGSDIQPFGLWEGIVPGAMLGSFLSGAATSTVFGVLAKLDQGD